MCEARQVKQAETGEIRRPLLPVWLRRPPGSNSSAAAVKRELRRCSLNTVCEEARCPNICECFAARTATFLILGDTCTRACRFCSVRSGKPVLGRDRFADEAERVAQAAASLALRHVVVTSVTRDDLEDGGAAAFVLVVRALRNALPQATIELLVPDFQGSGEALGLVLESAPDILNHNLETVPRLYPSVRPEADYHRSLALLRAAKELAPQVRTKTGIMLGLGETTEEVHGLMREARSAEVDIFTAGQYLQPSKNELPVARYVPPDEFDAYREFSLNLGFRAAYLGPLVRSSYHAELFTG